MVLYSVLYSYNLVKIDNSTEFKKNIYEIVVKLYRCKTLCWNEAVSQSTGGKPHCWLDTQLRNLTGTPTWAGHALEHAIGAEQIEHKCTTTAYMNYMYSHMTIKKTLESINIFTWFWLQPTFLVWVSGTELRTRSSRSCRL